VAPAPPDILTGLQRLIERQGGEAGRVAELLYRRITTCAKGTGR